MGRVAVGILIAGVIGAAIGYGSLKNYLHSDGFRRMLSAQVSKVLGMVGEFSLFRWDGLAVDTETFDATGTGLISSLHADRLHTEVNLSGVRRGWASASAPAPSASAPTGSTSASTASARRPCGSRCC